MKSTQTKISQSVRKRDDKARTFAPEDFKKDSLPEYNEKSNRFEQTEKDLKNNEFYEYELNISNSRIKYLDKIIKENPKMSAKEIDIINQLKSSYTTRKEYFNVKINNQKSEKADLRIVDDQIRNLEKEFRDQKGRSMFIS